MSERYKFHNPDGIYFVSPTITQWIDLFIKDNYRTIVINSLLFCIKNKGLCVHAWCIMPSHLHLIISRTHKNDLGAIIRDFKKYTNQRIIEEIKTGTDSRRDWMLQLFAEYAMPLKRIKNYKVWQDGNHPVELQTNEMLDQRLEYIHQNPVKACFVYNPEDYVYSSACDYVETKGLLPLKKIE